MRTYEIICRSFDVDEIEAVKHLRTIMEDNETKKLLTYFKFNRFISVFNS